METYQTAVSEQEIPKCNENVTNEQVKLLTMWREWTKNERLKYLEFRKQQENDKKRKWVKEYNKKSKVKSKVRSKPKKSSGRIKLWDWRTTDTDHLIARNEWGSNNIKNLKKANKIEHQEKHKKFWTKLVHRQIQQVVDEINEILEYNKQVVVEETHTTVVKAINHILKYFIEKWKFYEPVTFRNPNFIPKTL
jgi:hypothetical protein